MLSPLKNRALEPVLVFSGRLSRERYPKARPHPPPWPEAGLLCGGRTIDGDGYFVEPAIAKVENHWDIVQDETFAPILYRFLTFTCVFFFAVRLIDI